MEIRMRSAVSRTAKGYSIEATLDMGDDIGDAPSQEEYELVTHSVVATLSAFQIAELQKHMAKLGEAFPREQE